MVKTLHLELANESFVLMLVTSKILVSLMNCIVDAMALRGNSVRPLLMVTASLYLSVSL